MRRLFIFLALIVSVAADAQRPIPISERETVSLIFPFPIEHVDRGTKDVLVSRPHGADNILLVKATSGEMSVTNLSVILSDGSVYAFELEYMQAPSQFLYEMTAQKDASVTTYANGILDNGVSMRGPHESRNGVEARITGIYIHNGVMYYQLYLCNHSPIDYDISLCQWSLRDSRESKRTARQQVLLFPLHVSGNEHAIPANGFTIQVFAFPKLTIPDAKQLYIQLFERNGGRHLSLALRNKHLLRAIPLPDLF